MGIIGIFGGISKNFWGFLRWFLWELILFKIIISMIGSVFKSVSILFKMIINVIIFLLWKEVIETLGDIDKRFLGLWVSFFIDLKIASKNLSQNCLYHTTHGSLWKVQNSFFCIFNNKEHCCIFCSI